MYTAFMLIYLIKHVNPGWLLYASAGEVLLAIVAIAYCRRTPGKGRI